LRWAELKLLFINDLNLDQGILIWTEKKKRKKVEFKNEGQVREKIRPGESHHHPKEMHLSSQVEFPNFIIFFL
jgi:hypothetical protein